MEHRRSRASGDIVFWAVTKSTHFAQTATDTYETPMIKHVTEYISVSFVAATIHSLLSRGCVGGRLSTFSYVITSPSAVRPLKVYIRNAICTASSRRGQLQNGFQEPVRSFDPPEFAELVIKRVFGAR